MFGSFSLGRSPGRDGVSPSSFSSPISSFTTVELDVMAPEKNASRGFPNNSIKTSKYTILTFLPLNLLEQFRKFSNFYFLLVMIVSLIPGASPIDPVTAVLPLIIVLVVAGGKDGYEDYKRHVSDHRANSLETEVLRGDCFIKVPSRDLVVGDIVRFSHGEEIRADCLLLNSSLPDGLAYIETANLDGETNVKPRKPKHATVEELGDVDQIVRQCNSEEGVQVKGAEPTPSLASWQGQILFDGGTYSVGLEQFLFRGAIIRNTEWVLGVVLYTGVHTKMFLNLKQKPAKFSRMDGDINRIIIGLFVLNEVCILLLCGMSVWWTDAAREDDTWYLQYHINNITGVRLFFWRHLTYFILMSFMIPISLFVTLEINKATQLLLLSWDRKMSRYDRHTKTWKFCRPKTSNLNMQLAHVTSVFTDKTGTLTENCMNYKGGYVNGVIHDETTDLALHIDRETLTDNVLALPDHQTYLYYIGLALCHSVVCFKDEDSLDEESKVYEGPSPDEIALVRAAADQDFALIYRSSKQMVIRALDKAKAFNIIADLDFSAERKMMSMILQPTSKIGSQEGAQLGGYYLFTKGADSSVLPRADTSVAQNGEHMSAMTESLNAMASTGLRTLVLGYRIISEKEMNEWLPVFEDAQCSMGDRNKELHDAYHLVERDFHLLGTTAVEDKLQEKVPETIRFLLKAKVTVWMLTGDKRETAVTIGATSGLIDPAIDNVEHIDVSSMPMNSDEDFAIATSVCEEQLQQALTSAKTKDTVIVIDGVSLNCSFGINEATLFLEVGNSCKSAICCRLTPLQKADVVKLFQASTDGIVMAIGDGANDVSMIQEGKLGIGIMGLEGAQAELASDYAIPRFHHLKRLLFVHGRNCLYRDAQTILFSLYKNCMLSVALICYSCYSGFSGQSVFDSWLLASFNMFFCSLPPLFMGMFDKDIEDELAETHPQLYTPLVSENLFFNRDTFINFGFDFVVHGTLLYFMAHQTMLNDDLTWRSGSLAHYGTLLFIMVLVCIDTRAGMMISRWNFIQFFGVAISFVLIPCFLLAYSALPSVGAENYMIDVAGEVLASNKLYIHLWFVIGGVILILNISRSFYMETERPTAAEALRRRYRITLDRAN